MFRHDFSTVNFQAYLGDNYQLKKLFSDNRAIHNPFRTE